MNQREMEIHIENLEGQNAKLLEALRAMLTETPEHKGYFLKSSARDQAAAAIAKAETLYPRG